MRSRHSLQPRTIVKSLAGHLKVMEPRFRLRIVSTGERERRDLTAEFRRSIDLFWPEDAVTTEDASDC